MKLRCPACDAALPAEQINVRTDLALCAACGELSRVSDLSDETEQDALPPSTPPPGAWQKIAMDVRRYGATTRHGVAFMLLPFTLVWSGGSLGGIYGSQIKSGKLEPLLCLFGLPFLVGSIALIGCTAMALAGKVELRLRGAKGEVFTGVGSLGWTRRFDLAEIERITEEPTIRSHPGGHGWTILLAGRERLRFGSGLNENRRRFLLGALRAAHREVRR